MGSQAEFENKSFVIGLFLTPILMVVFGFLGNLMGGDTSDNETAKFMSMMS